MSDKKKLCEPYTLRQYLIPLEYLDMLNTLLFTVTYILDKNNIKYWADGGTALGQYRFGGQMPWDDDIDLGVMSNDKNRTIKILKEYIESETEYTFTYYPGDELIKVFLPNKWAKNDYQTVGTPTLDIFFYKKTKVNEIVLSGRSMRVKYPYAKHKYSDLFPLEKKPYNSGEICMPNNPVPYFNGSYPDWDKYIGVTVRKPPEPGRANIKDEMIYYSCAEIVKLLVPQAYPQSDHHKALSAK